MLRRRPDSGFSLIEVIVAMSILVLVATTAVATLRSGVDTLSATEDSAQAIDVVREFSEYTFGYTLEELDVLDGTVMNPVLANGMAFPDAADLTVEVEVTAVQDLDPTTPIEEGSSSDTRLVSVTVMSGDRQVMEAAWLVAVH